jgi:hypothetical protein
MEHKESIRRSPFQIYFSFFLIVNVYIMIMKYDYNSYKFIEVKFSSIYVSFIHP